MPRLAGVCIGSSHVPYPQVILFSRNVERLADLYLSLGFAETCRVPKKSPIHIDLALDGYTIGIASVESSRDDHGLRPVEVGQRAAVVLWTDDTESAYRHLVDLGGVAPEPPHIWLDRLLIAWVADPDDHPVQVVQRMTQADPAPTGPG